MKEPRASESSEQQTQQSTTTRPPKKSNKFGHNDIGNAERFVRDHGKDLRYVHGMQWHIWTGTHWERDETSEVSRRAQQTIKRMVGEANAKNDFALLKHAHRSSFESRLNSMIKLASVQEGVAAAPDDLDSKPMLLNVRNGTLDLRDCTLRSHERKDLLTHCLPTPFEPTAVCPTWLSFLKTAFQGDENLISFVQHAVGYSLTGSTEEQVLFFIVGTGANAKSTFLEVVRAMLGDLAQQATFDTFLAKRTSGIPNDIARLRGTRFVTASEADSDRPLAEATIKHLTGGDRVTARYLYKEFFEFTPTHKIWLAANHRPAVRDGGDALWRRIRLIPFAATIPKERRDPGLIPKLRRELPGILAWAVEGCRAWRQQGLGWCTAVDRATDEYRKDTDLFGQFLSECCERGTECSIGASDLHHRLTNWLAVRGEVSISQRALAEKLKSGGLQSKKVNGRVVWCGIGARS